MSEKKKHSGTQFSLMLQNRGLSQFGKIDGDIMSKNYDEETEMAISNFGDVTITLTGVGPKAFKVSTHKLLDALLVMFTQQNNYQDPNPDGEVRFLIDDFLRMTDTPVTKASRDKKRVQLKKDLDVLYALSLDYESHTNERIRRERVCSSYDIINSEVIFQFNQSFAQALINSYFVDLPTALLALPDTNQTPYYLGKKLAEHYTFTLNKERDTYNILSVRKLLEACPTIPTEADLKEVGNRNYSARIKTPFIQALNILANQHIIEWEFCNPRKEPLTEEQKENFNFRSFMNSYVHFTMLENQDGAFVEHTTKTPKRRKK